MKNFAAAILLLITCLHASLAVALELQLEVLRVPTGVRLIASAFNESESHINICGRWRFQNFYIPSPESVIKIARKDSIAAGNKFSRWEGCVPPPGPIRILGQLGKDNSISIAPAEAFSDTVIVLLSPTSYHNWPGQVEVRYYLDLCDDPEAPFAEVEANANGGVLMTQFAVPLGGV